MIKGKKTGGVYWMEKKNDRMKGEKINKEDIFYSL